ncbi:MAG: hypothetical protein JEY99_04545 [Spirochaetales bacterium]|nr:hypothetical protein [Spirochaetales bacterium]
MKENMTEKLKNKMMLKFDDPLVEKTEWTTISWGGHKFQDYEGFQSDETRFEFKITKQLYKYIIRLPVFLTLLGLFLFFLYLFFDFNLVLTVMFLGFLPLTGFGTAYLYHKKLSKPFVFDTRLGYFWKGNLTPESKEAINKTKLIIKTQDIYALQLLYQSIRPYFRSYKCYELNLVLNDGRRQILLDHCNRHKMEEDAEGLAKFLGVPLWNTMINP